MIVASGSSSSSCILTSPFALFHRRISLFAVTRALIVHLLEYGLSAEIGVMAVEGVEDTGALETAEV